MQASALRDEASQEQKNVGLERTLQDASSEQARLGSLTANHGPDYCRRVGEIVLAPGRRWVTWISSRMQHIGLSLLPGKVWNPHPFFMIGARWRYAVEGALPIDTVERQRRVHVQVKRIHGTWYT